MVLLFKMKGLKKKKKGTGNIFCFQKIRIYRGSKEFAYIYIYVQSFCTDIQRLAKL